MKMWRRKWRWSESTQITSTHWYYSWAMTALVTCGSCTCLHGSTWSTCGQHRQSYLSLASTHMVPFHILHMGIRNYKPRWHHLPHVLHFPKSNFAKFWHRIAVWIFDWLWLLVLAFQTKRQDQQCCQVKAAVEGVTPPHEDSGGQQDAVRTNGHREHILGRIIGWGAATNQGWEQNLEFEWQWELQCGVGLLPRGPQPPCAAKHTPPSWLCPSWANSPRFKLAVCDLQGAEQGGQRPLQGEKQPMAENCAGSSGPP